MLKTSPQLAITLPAIGVDNSEVVRSSGRNDRKLAKSDFIKLVRGAEEPGFLTSDARQAFTQLKQALPRPQSSDILTLSTISELRLTPLPMP